MTWIKTLLFTLGLVSLISTPVLSADIQNVISRHKPLSGSAEVLAKCDDGLPCTDDVSVNGKCTHTVKPGFCVIDGVCYARGQVNPKSSCQECRDDWGPAFTNRWGYDNSNACSDRNNCTSGDHCSSGTCVGTIDPSCK